MPRTHTIDPEITVIMETCGTHQATIGAAIQSFLRQTYKRAVLLILNYHPQRLRLTGLPAGAPVEVVNGEDVFQRHVYQHQHNLNQVRTDCWTILDDDDWIEPDHLANMAAAWNRCAARDDRPLRVMGAAYRVHYDDRVETKQFPGWAACLFERLTPAEVDWAFSRFPPDRPIGSDTWLAGCSMWDLRTADPLPATYHWDRRGGAHVSDHEHNRGETPADLFAYTLRYWQIKLAARAQTLRPVHVNHS